MPTGFMEATFDGEVTNYFEWLAAGKIERIHKSGAMHSEGEATGLIDTVFYGFNLDTLFMRLDYAKEFSSFTRPWSLTIRFLHPKDIKIEISINGKECSANFYIKKDNQWQEHSTIDKLASADIIELGLDFAKLGAVPCSKLKLYIEVNAGEHGQMRWPTKGITVIEVPGADYENLHWMV